MDDFQHIAIGQRVLRVHATGQGTPIVYLHGGLGSIHERPASDERLARLGIRLVRIGDGGAIDEMIALRTPWPFALAAISCPVQVWTGQLDRNTPPAGAQQLVDALPRARHDVVPGRGHNLIFTDAEPVLAALRDAVRAAETPSR